MNVTSCAQFATTGNFDWNKFIRAVIAFKQIGQYSCYMPSLHSGAHKDIYGKLHGGSQGSHAEVVQIPQILKHVWDDGERGRMPGNFLLARSFGVCGIFSTFYTALATERHQLRLFFYQAFCFISGTVTTLRRISLRGLI